MKRGKKNENKKVNSSIVSLYYIEARVAADASVFLLFFSRVVSSRLPAVLSRMIISQE